MLDALMERSSRRAATTGEPFAKPRVLAPASVASTRGFT
jgi:hypothetical protein